jgi:enoyl-CoA hydratase
MAGEISVKYEVRNRGAWITLNRPEVLNALSRKSIENLDAYLDRAAADPDVVAVILTGAGRAFCAGADLTFLNDVPKEQHPEEVTKFIRKATDVMRKMETLPKPVIAAVNGIATAGGLELVLCCDLVVAAESARLGDGHSNYGLLPGAGASARLPRKIGATRAKYLFFTGDLLPARMMQQAGLINDVVPDGALVENAEALLAKIVNKSPLGLRRMKQLADESLEVTLAQALAYEQTVNEYYAVSYDRQEGVTAFNEKRKPVFLGR